MNYGSPSHQLLSITEYVHLNLALLQLALSARVRVTVTCHVEAERLPTH
jgi:hypothetical protein